MRIAALAAALAAVAGFVDAVGYLTLHGLFVAHMSGNSVKFGVYAGRGALSVAAPAGIAVLLFIAGVGIGSVIAELAARRLLRSVVSTVLTVQIALIVAFMAYGQSILVGRSVADHSLGGFYVLAALGIVALGLQTAALRQLGGRTIATTYITGLLTSLAQEAANYLFWLRDGTERDERRSFLSGVLGLGSRRTSRNRVLLLGAVWLAYVAGGISGSFCDGRIRLWSLLIPIATLVAVIAVDLRHPLDL